MFGLLFGLLNGQLWFGGEDPARGRPWYHEMITWQAARDAGWQTDEPDDAGFDFDGVSEPWFDPHHSVVPGRPKQHTAAAALAWHADYLDAYLYNPFWWAAGGWSRFESAIVHRADLTKLHFDDLTSTAQIAAIWERIEEGTITALMWAVGRPDRVGLARNIVGASLHATQDFYAHSNWVDDPPRRKTAWFEVAAADRKTMHLYTGVYEDPEAGAFRPHGKFAFDCALLSKLPSGAMERICGSPLSPFTGTSLCDRWRACNDAVPGEPAVVLDPKVPTEIVMVHPGIANDSRWMSRVSFDQREVPDRNQIDADRLFRASYYCAHRHSVAWLNRLSDIMLELGHSDFWNEVKTQPRTCDRELPLPDTVMEFVGVYADDLRQWEETWRSAFTFLSAGTYPPAPDGTDEAGWFVRLDFKTGGTGEIALSLLASTNSDIRISVDDHPPELLDRRPHHPSGQKDKVLDPILDHNDFAAGQRDSYVIGPFAEIPHSLTLHNASPANFRNLIDAVFRDFVNVVETVKHIVLQAVLSLLSGHADPIGAETKGFSWHDLARMQVGVAHNEVIRIDGGSEGIYDLQFQLTCQNLSDGLRVRVQGITLHCLLESTVDFWSTSDEPIVHVMVTNAGTGQREAWQRSYNHVSTGSNRDLKIEHDFDVPRYGGLILGIQMIESDLEGIEGRKDLFETFKGTYIERTDFSRLVFIDTLGKMIAPDWLIERIEVHAFRRVPAAELIPLVHDRQLRQWLDSGTSLEVSLDTQLPAGPIATGARMDPGEVLYPGGQLWSMNGRYMLTYQPDGNLVLYGPGGDLWDSRTSGTTPGVLIMQDDGNLVIYNREGHPFDFQTWGHPGAWLDLQNDGKVVIRTAAGEVRATPTGVPVVTQAQGSKVNPGEGLYPGTAIWSPSGRYALWYETDGTLALHGPAGLVRRIHDAGHRPGVILVNDDGTLVVEEPGANVKILSDTVSPGAWLNVQDDANVVLYSADASNHFWTSRTDVPVGPVAESPFMMPGEILYPDNGRITSPAGEFSLVYQPDGNLCIYQRGIGATWGAGTENSPVGTVIFDTDGNLRIMAHGRSNALFETGTSRDGRGAFVMLRDDGRLTVNVDNEVVWESP